jgi:hypothetical protein
MTAVMNLLFSLPDVLMAEVFAFDNTHHGIFSSSKFKKELEDEWLQMQINNAKEMVDELIFNYIDDGERWMFSNEYCSIVGPQEVIEKEKGGPRYSGENFLSYDDFMIYFSQKNDVLYYKILPKTFIDKPKDFFQNLLFDGYFNHIDNQLSNFIEVEKRLRYGINYWKVNLDYFYLTKIFIEMHISGFCLKPQPRTVIS